MFGIKFVRHPGLHNISLPQIFDNYIPIILYRMLADILHIEIFLLPNICISIDPKNPISVVLYQLLLKENYKNRIPHVSHLTYSFPVSFQTCEMCLKLFKAIKVREEFKTKFKLTSVPEKEL